MNLFKRNIHIILCVLSVLLISTNIIYGQSAKLFRGVLYDEETSNPVRDAHIVTASHFATTTDYMGCFSIFVRQSDTISVSCLGYGKVNIYVDKCDGFESKVLTFRLKPVVYKLHAVEVPMLNSIVILPKEVVETVEVQGIEPVKDNLEIKISNDVNVKLERQDYKLGLPYFGIGFTINGFLSSLTKKDDKEERQAQARMEAEKNTEIFYNYIYSEQVRKLLMEDYKMTEQEYLNFIRFFIENAGNLKKSINEYDILKSILDKIEAQK